MLNEKKRATEVDSLLNEHTYYNTITKALARMKGNSQDKMILKHLLKHKDGITSFDAFEKYRITRLASRIHDLRNIYGVPITSTMEEDIHIMDGEMVVKRYARYRIERS